MTAPPVQYVRTRDGFNIAFAETGQGEPLVLMPSQFSHIELYWTQETFVRPWLQGLSNRFRFIQYDGRGQGLSQRNLPNNLSINDLAFDLEAIVDRLQLERFIVIGSQWWVHVAVRYAVLHPARVRALVLASSSIRAGDQPTFRTGLAHPQAIPDAIQDWEGFLLTTLRVGQPTDVRAALARLRQTITPEDWLKLYRAAAKSDLTDSLGRLNVPTLVLQPRDLFRMEPSAELAAAICGARVVYVDGAPPLGDAEPGLIAIDSFVQELESRRVGLRTPRVTAAEGLSPREHEVLRLLAQGKSNAQIAGELVISLNTVNRHVSNIYSKTGAANRAAAVAYAKDHQIA